MSFYFVLIIWRIKPTKRLFSLFADTISCLQQIMLISVHYSAFCLHLLIAHMFRYFLKYPEKNRICLIETFRNLWGNSLQLAFRKDMMYHISAISFVSNKMNTSLYHCLPPARLLLLFHASSDFCPKIIRRLFFTLHWEGLFLYLLDFMSAICSLLLWLMVIYYVFWHLIFCPYFILTLCFLFVSSVFLLTLHSMHCNLLIVVIYMTIYRFFL